MLSVLKLIFDLFVQNVHLLVLSPI